MIRFTLCLRQLSMREEIRDGNSGKSLRTAGHFDQYSGCTSTISRAVLDASRGGQSVSSFSCDATLSRIFLSFKRRGTLILNLLQDVLAVIIAVDFFRVREYGTVSEPISSYMSCVRAPV